MSTGKKILKRVVLIIIGIMLAFSMYPFEPYAEKEIGIKEFQSLIESGELSIVNYNVYTRIAFIKSTKSDNFYKMKVISDDEFTKAINDYSIEHEAFRCNIITEPKKEFNIVYYLLVYFCWYIIVSRTFDVIFKSNSSRIFDKNNPKKKKNSSYNKEESEEKDGFYDLKAALGIETNYRPRKIRNVKIRFSDVIGLEKQLDDIQDIVRFLKEPEEYKKIGAKLPKGILLYGKPGVGKTHIANAIAGEAGVPFFEVSATEMESKFVGDSEANIRKLFNEAKKCAPSIIYIDEIDSIASRRFSDGTNQYHVKVVNQLLACMDGFNKDDNVLIIASTNNIDSLDSAILRSGRFDRKIYIHRPDKEARRKLFEYYSKDKVIDDSVSMDSLVSMTAGLTGADIKTIMNESAILTVRYGLPVITEDIILEAFRQVELGSQNSYAPIPKERRYKTAVHEAGHALISKTFGKHISEISIISRGNAAGYNLNNSEEDLNFTCEELKQKIMIYLGGRSAEEVVFSEVSIGASDDLRRATDIVKNMFLRFSMGNGSNISLVVTDDKALNDKLIKESYNVMNDYLASVYNETIQIIREKKSIITELAELIMEKETLSENDIEEFFRIKFDYNNKTLSA